MVIKVNIFDYPSFDYFNYLTVLVTSRVTKIAMDHTYMYGP